MRGKEECEKGKNNYNGISSTSRKKGSVPLGLINNAALVILIFLINHKQPRYISICESILCDVSITIWQYMQPHENKMEWAGLLIVQTRNLVICIDYQQRSATCFASAQLLLLCFRLSPSPTGAICLTRQPPMLYQWLNPSSLTSKTFAKPATGMASVSASPERETLQGTAFISLSQRCWRCRHTSQEAKLAQSSLPQRKFNYTANYMAEFASFHLFFVPVLAPACKVHPL